MTPPSCIPSETTRTIARLVIEWAKARNVGHLSIFVSSVRSWIVDIPPISLEDAAELAKVSPYSADHIFLAFSTQDAPPPPNRIRDDRIKRLGGYGG